MKAQALQANTASIIRVDFRTNGAKPAKNRRRNKRATFAADTHFWPHVLQGSAAECHLWDGTIDHGNGYGRLWNVQGAPYAHRKAWELSNGRKVPAGKHVLHRCQGNKRCCNPAHLYLGTQKNNADDTIRAGRMTGPKLTGKSVLAIRDARYPEFPLLKPTGATYTALAERHGVCNQTIFRICKGVTWGHVTGLIGGALIPPPSPKRIRAAA